MATKTRELADFLIEGSSDLPLGKPHITPGVLYPAVFGKLLDGTTNHSNAYGTAQSDGHSYYYTDIKGSKPIKDPRIGAHFGSQRHKFKSIQLLKQETATHGESVYSVDGREWIRAVGSIAAKNDAWGNYIEASAYDSFIEIVGYFYDANISALTWNTQRHFTWEIDGTSTTTITAARTSATSPLGVSRYVDAGSVINIAQSSAVALGIHTLKIINRETSGTTNQAGVWFGVELIAQDTTSTATKSQIQIPSQNVVSYGKKFSLSATAHHYNPFATKGDGSASTIPNNTTGDRAETGWVGSTDEHWESTLDTATSLGLGAWESGGNFYRPVNGGRIVKWVDSTGTIKTSVNMMPPEAHSITEANTIAEGTAAATGTHNWSTQYLPQFGHKTVGSNLITSWATTSDTVETLTSTGANITQFTNSTGWGTATTNDLGLTVGRLYKIQISNYDHTSGVGLRIFTGTNGTSANGTIGVTNLTNDTPSSHTFRAGTSDTKLSLGVQSEAAAAADTINFTLYEVEEPSLQAEVAKFCHFAEFGNGTANGNATYQDWTQMGILSNKTPAYVMDDGLTSLSGNTFKMAVNNSGVGTGGVYIYNAQENSSAYYLIFIGTGVSIRAEITTSQPQGTTVVAQNLPYGTHIMKVFRTSSHNTTLWIDGVQFFSNASAWINFWYPAEFVIHQPKMPLIPDDACIISDYMLMADFVPKTAMDVTKLSKGVRRVSPSRDLLFDEASGGTFALSINSASGSAFKMNIGEVTSGSTHGQLPAFCTNTQVEGYDSDGRLNMTVDGGSAVSTTGTSGGDWGDVSRLATDLTLGIHTIRQEVDVSASASYMNMTNWDVVTPIHTSSHYQTFETPYLHELVGGDRNMEQTNLVVTADGKTWDEVTRDTSYIGDTVVQGNCDAGEFTYNVVVPFDEWRGFNTDASYTHNFNKDFAIAYDRFICLVDAEYEVTLNCLVKTSGSTQHARVVHNSSAYSSNIVLSISTNISGTNEYNTASQTATVFLKRGDWLSVFGGYWAAGDNLYSGLSIKRM